MEEGADKRGGCEKDASVAVSRRTHPLTPSDWLHSLDLVPACLVAVFLPERTKARIYGVF